MTAPPRDARQASGASKLRAVLGVLAGISMIAYPMAFYAGVTHWSLRGASIVLLVFLAPTVWARLRAFDRSQLRPGDMATMALVPVLAAALVGAGAVLNHLGFALFVPAAIHVLLLLAFGPTLATERPMVERFARLQHADLSDAERAWCRLWTWIWSGFFAANLVGSGALAVAVLADAEGPWMFLWTLYNGAIAYALIGTLVTVEWMLRKARFGRFGDAWPERLLVRCIPAARRTYERERGAAQPPSP